MGRDTRSALSQPDAPARDRAIPDKTKSGDPPSSNVSLRSRLAEAKKPYTTMVIAPAQGSADPPASEGDAPPEKQSAKAGPEADNDSGDAAQDSKKPPGVDSEKAGEGCEETAAAAGARDSLIGGTSEAPQIEDPDLIALLEQLSATIDSANLALAKTPPFPPPDEYAAAGTPERPAQLPPTQVLRRLRGRRSPIGAALVAAALASAAGGFYLWMRTDPELLERASSLAIATLPAVDARTERKTEPAEQPVKNEAKLPTPMPETPPPPPQRLEQPKAPPAAETAAVTPAATEPAQSATLVPPPVTPKATDAAEPLESVRGPAGNPISLGVTAPKHAAGDDLAVMIRDVPQQVKLTAGTHIGGGTWIVEEQDLVGLALVTPASFSPGAFTLDVTLVMSDGKVPQTRSISVVVEPAHAPVPPATHDFAAEDAGKAPPPKAPADLAARGPAPGGPAPTSPTSDKGKAPPPVERPALDKEREARFLTRASELLKLGDVASARLLLEYAARRGSKPAMLELAKTYDPEHLSKLGVYGVKADMNQASVWYERASRQADR